MEVVIETEIGIAIGVIVEIAEKVEIALAIAEIEVETEDMSEIGEDEIEKKAEKIPSGEMLPYSGLPLHRRPLHTLIVRAQAIHT